MSELLRKLGKMPKFENWSFSMFTIIEAAYFSVLTLSEKKTFASIWIGSTPMLSNDLKDGQKLSGHIKKSVFIPLYPLF